MECRRNQSIFSHHWFLLFTQLGFWNHLGISIKCQLPMKDAVRYKSSTKKAIHCFWLYQTLKLSSVLPLFICISLSYDHFLFHWIEMMQNSHVGIWPFLMIVETLFWVAKSACGKGNLKTIPIRFCLFHLTHFLILAVLDSFWNEPEKFNKEKTIFCRNDWVLSSSHKFLWIWSGIGVLQLLLTASGSELQWWWKRWK